MAVYVGDYINDFGKQFPISYLRVGLITNVDLQNSRGQFNLTQSDFDIQYLPKIFIEKTRLKTSRDGITECKTDIIKRFGKLYLSSSEYLKVELPFLPDSTEFNQFFIDAYFSNLSTIQTIGYEGEFIPNYQLEKLLK